jgi:uncharacterized protein (DUF1800 family)
MDQAQSLQNRSFPMLTSRIRYSSGDLDSFDQPLTRSAAAHLARRVAFGSSAKHIDQLVGLNSSDAVDEIVDAAAGLALPEAPDWVDNVPPPRGSSRTERQEYNMLNNRWLREYSADWISRMAAFDVDSSASNAVTTILASSFRERMTLFWHNHFVTGIEVYRWAVLSYRYLTTLRRNALGRFEPFVYAIGIDPSMLLYLNGTQNRAGAANENYARELMELFTMSPANSQGQPNYTEDDIKNIAKALTGWVVDLLTAEPVFLRNRHDSSVKIIFSRSGNFGYDDVVSILFEERRSEIAYHISNKLYIEFVHAEPDPVAVSELATVLEQSDFSISQTVKTLLKSQHFFTSGRYGTNIKSPVDHMLGTLSELGSPTNDRLFETLNRVTSLSDQHLFNPPNVAGWPGYRDWISTNSLPLRWLIGDELLFGGNTIPTPSVTEMAQVLHDQNDPMAAFYLPAAIAEHLFAVPVESLDVAEIAEEFGGDLDQFPVPEDVRSAPPHVRNLSKLFLAGAPWYEWFLLNPGSEDRLKLFVSKLLQYPEYQLK